MNVSIAAKPLSATQLPSQVEQPSFTLANVENKGNWIRSIPGALKTQPQELEVRAPWPDNAVISPPGPHATLADLREFSNDPQLKKHFSAVFKEYGITDNKDQELIKRLTYIGQTDTGAQFGEVSAASAAIWVNMMMRHFYENPTSNNDLQLNHLRRAGNQIQKGFFEQGRN